MILLWEFLPPSGLYMLTFMGAEDKLKYFVLGKGILELFLMV